MAIGCFSRATILALLLVFASGQVFAQSISDHPLAGLDTSSPRATLRSFLIRTDSGLSGQSTALDTFLNSGLLYRNTTEKQALVTALSEFGDAAKTLDRSGIPVGFRDSLAVDQVILLAEILARITLPDLASVPSAAEMKEQSLNRWFIPNTRIEIRRIEDGPRSGEYLFAAQTVLDLWLTHNKVKSLPPNPGAVRNFYENLPDSVGAMSILDINNSSAIGLSGLPDRWLLQFPQWLKFQIINVPVWKWASLVSICVLLWAGLLTLRNGLMRGGLSEDWRQVYNLLGWVFAATCFVWYMGELRVGGMVLVSLGTLGIVVQYLASAAAAYSSSGVLAENSVKRRELTEMEIDSQFVRFIARLIGLVVAVTIIIQGANQIGLPAYSIVSGLGIGAIAVGFAAQDALNNFLGSVIIMFEKPFRNGQWITVNGVSGTVELVGFRSTWIRTSADSLVSVPNGTISNSKIDNLGKRGKRRQQFSVYVANDTGREKLEELVQGVWQIIDGRELTDSGDINVRLKNIGHDGLEIYLYFFLKVSGYAAEQKEREAILLEIVEFAESIGVAFAYPTQTLHLANQKP